MKLDIGCGPNKKDGFTGIDQYPFDGVDIVGNVLDGELWARFEPGSIEEIYTSHFVEHLTGPERCTFFNHAWRALKPGAQIAIVVPAWSSSRAYGDPTHKWPPVGEFSFFYLDKDWRAKNAPHTDAANWPQGYACDFTGTWGYGLHPQVQTRNPEFQQFAVNFYKEAAQDIHATLTARK